MRIDFNELPTGILQSGQVSQQITFSSGGRPAVWIYWNHGTRNNVLSDAGGAAGVGPIWIEAPGAIGFEMRLIGFSTVARVDLYSNHGSEKVGLWTWGGDVWVSSDSPWEKLVVYAGPGDRISIDDFSTLLMVPEPSSMWLLLLGLLLVAWGKRVRSAMRRSWSGAARAQG